MKTAAELLAIKAFAQKELEEQHTDTMIAFLGMIENAKNLCDTFINEEMISKAKRGESLTMTFKIYMAIDCLNNIFFYLVKEDTRHRRHNQYFTYDYSIGYAYNAFVEYLNSHGFDVVRTSSTYNSYFMGKHYCHELTITAKIVENLES